MKIAVFHNYLDNIGGAEMVALFLARELGADIYTTNVDLEKIKKMGFDNLEPRIFSIGSIPKIAPFRQQLALLYFRQLNLSKKYDFFIIAGDWAMSAAVNNQPNIWYVHSPLNELWEFQLFIKKELLSLWKKPIYNLWVNFNRKLTLKYAKHVNSWVCNSLNTKNRIKKYYLKDSLVINPPINTNEYKSSESKGYWLSVNRLAVHKRIEIQLEAFKSLPNEKLIIVGSYEKDVPQFENYKTYLEKIKPTNVTFLHWLNKTELLEFYGECKGFITTSKDEDFGMTVIEAMAAGKPVICPNEGGYKESIGTSTGILLDNIDNVKLKDAIQNISGKLITNKNFYKDACIKRASEFDTKVFINKIKEAINATLENIKNE